MEVKLCAFFTQSQENFRFYKHTIIQYALANKTLYFDGFPL